MRFKRHDCYHDHWCAAHCADTLMPLQLMIEPTESESLAEMDRFVDALLSIRQEIREVEEGTYPEDNNVLVNAPHDQQVSGRHARALHRGHIPSVYARILRLCMLWRVDLTKLLHARFYRFADGHQRRMGPAVQP